MVDNIIVVDIKEFTSPQHCARKLEEVLKSLEDKELPESTNCPCGEESVYGCHGVKNNEVYTEYLCKKCYHKE